MASAKVMPIIPLIEFIILISQLLTNFNGIDKKQNIEWKKLNGVSENKFKQISK